MSRYVKVVNGKVCELIAPLVIDGVEISIDARYHKDVVDQLILIDDKDDLPEIGSIYADGEFVVPSTTLTADEILAKNSRLLQSILESEVRAHGYDSVASSAIYVSPTAIVGEDAISVSREKYRLEANAIQEMVGTAWAILYSTHESLGSDAKVYSLEEIKELLPEPKWP